MNKLASIVFHSNASDIYPPEWIAQNVESIEHQTYKDFDLFELCYGEKMERYYKGDFEYIPMPNHVHALNHMIDKCFGLGYDYVAINNIDDYNELTRYEVQMKVAKDIDIVASNFRYIDGKTMIMTAYGDIGNNLQRNHNVICHPSVIMNKTFWSYGIRYEENELGREDLELWKRAINRGKRFCICPQILVNYRLHPLQVSKTYKQNK